MSRDKEVVTIGAFRKAAAAATVPGVPGAERVASAVTVLGGLAFVLALAMPGRAGGWGPLAAVAAATMGGGVWWIHLRYAHTTHGIKHDGVFHGSATNRGLWGWVWGLLFTGFYVVLYWWESWFAGASPLTGGWQLLEPLSQALRGRPADKWFLYGTLYTGSMAVLGYRMLMKYRHNRYQVVRTGSVIFFQLGFAWLLPGLLQKFEQNEFYFTYFWPLKYDYLFPSGIGWLVQSGGVGYFMVGWGVAMSFVAVPLLTWRVGKRWYCSWVCGCGGLAETVGDPWRQLSDKSVRAWRIERWMIHSVLVLIVVTTAALWASDQWGIASGPAASLKKFYGFWIGAAFSGVVGVGFYPLLGSRVWCRFGCPQAAILGLLQRFFSRFRITTNGGQCMSCGNCSTYCEMGIDVRSYAQRGENIVRASCVGCGVCAAVCPRGVLRLENGDRTDRFDGADRPVADFLTAIRRP